MRCYYNIDISYLTTNFPMIFYNLDDKPNGRITDFLNNQPKTGIHHSLIPSLLRKLSIINMLNICTVDVTEIYVLNIEFPVINIYLGIYISTHACQDY